MGYNSGVLILNDAVGQLDDPHVLNRWWERLRPIVVGCGSKLPANVPIGNHGNGSSVFHVDHSSVVGVYAIGHNTASQLSLHHDGNADPSNVELLRKIADDLGFRLVSKT